MLSESFIPGRRRARAAGARSAEGARGERRDPRAGEIVRADRDADRVSVGQAGGRQYAVDLFEARRAGRRVPHAGALRRAGARHGQADAEERQRPVVLRSRKPGERADLARPAAARAGRERRRRDGQSRARLHGRAEGRRRHRRRRPADPPRIPARAHRPRRRADVPPHRDLDRRGEQPAAEGALLFGERPAAEDRVLPALHDAARRRAADGNGHHRRLDSNWVTVMRFSDYAWRDIPDAWLQRDYLSRFQAQ